MQIHPINQQILTHIKDFYNLTEVENYINSEKFKNLTIEFQIDKIKKHYDKRYIQQIEEQIPIIYKNLHFSINNFKLENKLNSHLSPYVCSDQEKKIMQHTYHGNITIQLDEPFYYNGINPTFLFKDTIFHTGNGGGGNISKYEFYFLEKHLPNLATQFLLDFKKSNSLLTYRNPSSNQLENDSTAIFLNTKQLTSSSNKLINKQKLYETLENIFDSHFHNDILNDVLHISIVHNVIYIYSKFFNNADSQLNQKYIQYLKNTISFIQKEQNLDKIIEHNLSGIKCNGYEKYENIERIKVNIKNINKSCNLLLMQYGSFDEKIAIYNKIIHNNLIPKNEAIYDKDFLNYCFNLQDDIPKFFDTQNIYQNISYYISTNIKLSQEQKSKNENFILNLLQNNPNTKVTQSIMTNFLYSGDTSSNSFNIVNKQLINFSINHYISIQSNKPLDKLDTSHFLKICKYINSFDNYQFELFNLDIAIPFLFILTHQKNIYQNSQNTVSTNSYNLQTFQDKINIFDSIFEKINQYISQKSLINQSPLTKKIKI